MPLPNQDLFQQPPAAIGVALEPACNIFYDLALLNRSNRMPGLHDWVLQTRERMSLDEIHRHELVLIGFYTATIPEFGWQSFLGYIDYLARLDPQVLLEKILSYYESGGHSENLIPHTREYQLHRDQALQSVDIYLEFLKERFGNINEEVEAHAYTYLTRPIELQSLIPMHLRQMWDKYMASEWARVKPMLQESVKAFQQVDFGRMNKIEAFHFVTGQETITPHLEEILSLARRVIYIPNAHIGPYLGQIFHGDTLGIVFGARLPAGSRIQAPDLSANEMAVRLDALADEMRLRILRLVAENGELCSGDIMLKLDLSRSTASRHLTQLTATGFLNERRVESAKYYRLNANQVEHISRAIPGFLLNSVQALNK